MSDRQRYAPTESAVVLTSAETAAATANASVERTSEHLLRAVSDDGSARISIGDLVAALDERAFGLILLILALPNCVPAPPGIGGITGAVMAVFAVQMLLGRHRPWLPGFLERRSFDRAGMRRMLLTAAPYIRRFERIAKPRLLWASDRRAERIVGAALLVLAFVVSLPIPLTNWVPGLAIAVIAIGYIERDGAAMLLGLALGIGGIALAVSVTGAFFVLLAGFLTQAVG